MYISEDYVEKIFISEGLLTDFKVSLKKNIINKFSFFLRKGIKKRQEAVKELKEAGLNPKDLIRLVKKEFTPVAQELVLGIKQRDFHRRAGKIKSLAKTASKNVGVSLRNSIKNLTLGTLHSLAVAVGLIIFFACCVVVLITLAQAIPVFGAAVAGRMDLVLLVCVAIYGGLSIELEREDSREDNTEAGYLFTSTLIRIASIIIIPGSIPFKIFGAVLSIFFNYLTKVSHDNAEDGDSIFIIEFLNWFVQTIAIFIQGISLLT